MKKLWGFFTVLFLAALTARAAAPAGDLLAGITPGADGKIDVLVVIAHPDDESITLGGSLIKLKKNPRVRLHIVCMTLGDASDARLWMGIGPEEMARLRTQELKDAAAALGADELVQLPYHDQGLKPADRQQEIDEVAAIMVRTGAELVITHEPAGITRHPDHVTCSAVTFAAFQRSSAQKLYYATLPWYLYAYPYLVTPFHEPGRTVWPTVRVDITAERRQKLQAIFAHHSQVRHSLVGLEVGQFYLVENEWFAVGPSRE
jgi:LmbE family N-acetylglucosaminyl deacetylase